MYLLFPFMKTNIWTHTWEVHLRRRTNFSSSSSSAVHAINSRKEAKTWMHPQKAWRASTHTTAETREPREDFLCSPYCMVCYLQSPDAGYSPCAVEPSNTYPTIHPSIQSCQRSKHSSRSHWGPSTLFHPVPITLHHLLVQAQQHNPSM